MGQLCCDTYSSAKVSADYDSRGARRTSVPRLPVRFNTSTVSTFTPLHNLHSIKASAPLPPLALPLRSAKGAPGDALRPSKYAKQQDEPTQSASHGASLRWQQALGATHREVVASTPYVSTPYVSQQLWRRPHSQGRHLNSCCGPWKLDPGATSGLLKCRPCSQGLHFKSQM